MTTRIIFNQQEIPSTLEFLRARGDLPKDFVSGEEYEQGELDYKRPVQSDNTLTLPRSSQWSKPVNIDEVIKRVYSTFSVAFLPFSTLLSESTEMVFLPVFKYLDDETINFISVNKLEDSIVWLQTNASCFFPGADFEIELLTADDKDDRMLALRVHDNLPVPEFRARRHALCEAARKGNHQELYEIISIFQQEASVNEWIFFSSDCAFSAE